MSIRNLLAGSHSSVSLIVPFLPFNKTLVPLPFSDKEADASIPVRKDDPKDWRYQRSMKAAVRDRHRGKQTHHDLNEYFQLYKEVALYNLLFPALLHR